MLFKKTKKISKSKIPASLPTEEPLDPRHERAVERGLSAIYRDEKGALPDLSNFDPIKSKWWLYALISIGGFIIILILAAWAGFSIFKPYRGFSGQGLEIKIEGAEQIALGQEMTYFINYHNRTSSPIAAADLRVSFPTDFTVSKAEPRPTSEPLIWKLGAIPTDGRGTITVRGTFTGAIGTVTALQVVGTYRPSSFNSDFEALATKVLNYTDSVLDGLLVVPVKVLPGDKVRFDYSVKNRGLDAYDSLHVRLNLPDGFQLESVTSGILEGKTIRIPIGTLAAGASTTVSVSGTFATGVSGEAHLTAETGRLAADNSFLPAQRTETSFTVLAGDLSLKLVMNGRDADSVIEYGSPLRFALSYENTSSEELKNVQLSFHLEAVSTTMAAKIVLPLVDWKSLRDSASGTRKGDTITWSDDNIAALTRLPAHQDGIIDVDVNSIRNASGTGDLAIKAYIEASIESVGSAKVNRVVRSAPMVLRYISDANVVAEARYYSEEGAPLGAGPLPPVVGEATTYRVRWTVTKSVHELKDLKIKAALPKIASWTGVVNAEAGEITYDSSNRIATWDLNRLPENMNEATVEFEVRIVPGESDANRFAQILGAMNFEALDANLNEKLTRAAAALTTDLQNDEYAQAKGVVRNSN